MKNKITKYILLAFTCLGLQACLFQEDDIFEKSSANRATENVAELQELLVNVPNGWKMEYYPGTDYSMGGITLLCRFDGNNVTLMSEVGSVKTASGKEASSLYKVTSEESTVLTFDSFNEFIHCFSEPIMGMNTNLEGDYEFVYMGQEDNKVILQGRRYHNTMVMTPLTQGVNWKDYIGQLNLIEREAFLKTYSLMVGGQEVGNAVRTSHLFSLTVEGQTSSSVPFIYTPEADGAKKLYYMVKEGTNMGLFNTLAGAIPTTRLKNWGVLIEKNQVGALLSGVGYLKLGAASECGTIVTPELSCLSGKAKIKVSFDASPYQEVPKMDPLTMKILVIDGASSNKVEKGGAVPGMAGTTYSGACVNVITGGTTTVAQTFSLSSTYGYASYSYEISGVTSTSRIAIATDRNDVAGQHRCYLDNIKIEVVAYE